MKYNKLIHFAFISALLLISIAIGDNTNNNNNNHDQNKPVIVNNDNCGRWSDTWEEWSECKDGVQTRTKLCHCGEIPPVKNENLYKRGLPNDNTDSVEGKDTQYTDGKHPTSGDDNSVDQPAPSDDYSAPQPSGDYSNGETGKETGGDYTVDQPAPSKDNIDHSSPQPSGDYPVDQPAPSKDNDCTCNGTQPIETRACPAATNQSSCEWSDWGEFSECSKSCGGGVKTRTRQCKCNNNTENSSGSNNSGHNSGVDQVYTDSGSDKSQDNSYTSVKRTDSTEVYTDSTNEKTDNNNNLCSGLAEETVSCNTQLCDDNNNNNNNCIWDNSFYSEWSTCKGGVRRRYAICSCDEDHENKDDVTDYNSDTSKDYSTPTQNSDNDQTQTSSRCPEPQPYEEEPCNEEEVPSPDTYPVEPTPDTYPEEPIPDVPSPEPTKPECKWDQWSEWTICDKYCNGEQFRKQLCNCTGVDSDSDSYSDDLCLGTALTESRSCNNTENGDLCSNVWAFLDEWSPCVSENHYCGNGTQWRRQFCSDQDGSVLDDEDCLFTGEVPLFERRECTMDQQCCEFGELVYVKCDSLYLDEQNPSACVISWGERDCTCGNNKNNDDYDNNNKTTDYTQCMWTRSLLENPPIFYDPETDTCPSSTDDNADYKDTDDKATECFEYYNETCHSWTVNHKSGEVSSVSDINECDSEDCSSSLPSCWDEWTDWSPCAGTCDEAYQWRRQTTTKGLSACRQPPAYQYRSCNITDCCKWVFNDSIEWSDCTTPCGEGKQMRFPYTCSCDDVYQCPPPEFEFETKDCEFEDITCPERPIETPETPQIPEIPEYPETPQTPEIQLVCEWREDVSECSASCSLSEDSYDSPTKNEDVENGSDMGSDSGYDKEIETGSDKGYEKRSNKGSNKGSEVVENDNGYNNNKGSNKGSEVVETDNGYGKGSDKESNKGSEVVESDNGYGKGSDKGSEVVEADNGYGKGSDKGSNGSEKEHGKGSKKGSKSPSPKNCTRGCLTVKMSCYCNGNLSDNSLCPSTQLALTQNRNCSLNCDRCEWTNLSKWSPCTRGTQYQTRECSCEYRNQSRHKDDRFQKRYSSFCNGYTRISRSCEPIRILSVESWKNASWPEANDTQSRNFSSCSKLTWSQLINKTSLNNWETLAAEVIAVHLNILSGAASEDDISKDLKKAEKLLTSCKWSASQKNQSEELLDTLSQFNTEKDTHSLESATNENSASNSNQSATSSLLLLVLVPTIVVIVVVAIMVVAALIIIKRRRKNTDNIVTEL